MRQIIPEGRRQIELDEGLPGGKPALKAYRCSAGVPTIGFGHTRGVVMGMTCSAAQAERWLDEDLDEAERAVATLVKVPLNDWQFAALVSFVFNVGVGAFKASSLLRLLNTGDYAAVPVQMMRWVKETDPKTKKKVTSRGLVNRRTHEIATWSRGNEAPIEPARPATPAPPPAPTKVLQTSTGKAQAAALVAGAGGAALDAAGKAATGGFGETVSTVVQHVTPMVPYLDSLKYVLVACTVATIAWTLWDRRRKLREGR